MVVKSSLCWPCGSTEIVKSEDLLSTVIMVIVFMSDHIKDCLSICKAMPCELEIYGFVFGFNSSF